MYFNFNLIKNHNFYSWFADSKVVDSNNEPLVMYHKSRSKELFSVFDINGVDKNPYNNHYGVFFVPYYNSSNISYIANGLEYYVFIKIENPFIIHDNQGGAEDMFGKKLTNIDICVSFCEHIQTIGYDGIIVKSKHYDQYVVFHPNQIKSIDNNGNYSLDNYNIFE